LSRSSGLRSIVCLVRHQTPSDTGTSARPAAAGGPPLPTHRAVTTPRCDHPRRRAGIRAAASWSSVDIEVGKNLLDREGYLFLDVRSEREYDAEHITKPPRSTLNVPIFTRDGGSVNPAFLDQVSRKCRPATKLLVADADGGQGLTQAMKALAGAGFSAALAVEGGYAAWRAVFSTGGRRKPPKGRWVPTGNEALKSGLNIEGAAESYTEGGDLNTARWVPKGGEVKAGEIDIQREREEWMRRGGGGQY